MSWLFSRALVEAPLAEGYLDGEPFAPSSGTPTPQAYLWRDRTTEVWNRFPSGMTCEPLTDEHGHALLMWSVVASPAKTSARPGEAPASTESAAECGGTWPASLAKFDPDTCSWRTAQHSLLGDLDESSVTWPRSGITVDGRCWERPMLEPLTSGTGSGLSVPTPTASGFECQDIPRLLERRAECKVRNGNGNGFGLTLNQWVKVQMWPTPTSSNGLDGGSHSRAAQKKRGQDIPAGGSLNPPWVEWLMGWPIGWTDLEPLETGKSRSAQRQHSPRSPQSLSEATA